MEHQKIVFEKIKWNPMRAGQLDDYLRVLDLSKLSCMEFDSLRAMDVEELFDQFKKRSIAKYLSSLQRIKFHDCSFNGKCIKKCLKFLRQVPSIIEFQFNSSFDNKKLYETFWKEMHKVKTLKRIYYRDFLVDYLGYKEALRFLNTSQTVIDLEFSNQRYSENQWKQVAQGISCSTTIRSLKLVPFSTLANNHISPSISSMPNLESLSLVVTSPGYSFSTILPSDPTTTCNLRELDIDGQSHDSADTPVIFQLVNNNTKLTKLSLLNVRHCSDLLGETLARNTTLKSLQLDNIDMTESLIQSLAKNTSLTDIRIPPQKYLSACQSVTSAVNKNLTSLSVGTPPPPYSIYVGCHPNAAVDVGEPSDALCKLLQTSHMTKLELNFVPKLDMDLLFEGLNSPNNKITDLRMCYQSMKGKMESFVGGMERNSKIRSLDLSFNELRDDDYKHIWTMIEKNRTITSLIINDITEMPDKYIADLMQALKINRTLLHLTIKPKNRYNVMQQYINDHEMISLISFEPLSEHIQVDLILREKRRAYIDLKILYNNFMRCRTTDLPLELWRYIFSFILSVAAQRK